MNQARIWLVVKPTVGLPLFLGTVLLISLLVHYSVLSNTTWMAAFFEGGASAQVSQVAAPDAALAANREMTP
ncbi:MAG: light-harvesting protein [Gammaproteobacteria bacterium]|nr:light-harvesting protein [Gammaproteobacteria bacterium]TVQ46945.1 MAG: light-harvesting protein [Gammaproteobacteria bacterium]